jgi:hypothetical protein
MTMYCELVTHFLWMYVVDIHEAPIKVCRGLACISIATARPLLKIIPPSDKMCARSVVPYFQGIITAPTPVSWWDKEYFRCCVHHHHPGQKLGQTGSFLDFLGGVKRCSHSIPTFS